MRKRDKCYKIQAIRYRDRVELRIFQSFFYI